jgi:hypothetical protein
MDIEQYISNLSREDLIAKFDQAKQDLEEAATSQRNSEWHHGCFAACLLLGDEMRRRNIDLRVLN